jgi:putative transcriptional regulator
MKRGVVNDEMSVFEQIETGLRQSIIQARGQATLRTTVLPAPVPKLSRSRVAAIRKRVGVSQAVFARYLNIPVRTLQSWEQGLRTPKAGEARLLQLFEASPDECTRLVLQTDARGPRGASKPQRRRTKAA